MSLSARRAWIEMWHIHGFLRGLPVALRKESVDRNSTISATFKRDFVALRKESVDRNAELEEVKHYGKCRSPQGERG